MTNITKTAVPAQTAVRPPERLTQALTRPGRPPRGALLSAALFSVRTLLTNPWILGFSLGLPMFMYVMFAVGKEYSDVSVGHGNVAAKILVNMAVYGGLIAVANIGVTVSLERKQGWLRLLATTPLGVSRWVGAKIIAASLLALLLLSACFAFGYLSGAKMDSWQVWAATLALAWLVTLVAASFGMAAGFGIGSDSAFAVVGGGSSVLAFASGMFIPVDQMAEGFQKVVPYMPFYGTAEVPTTFLYGVEHFRWQWVASLLIWTFIFVLIAMWGARRGTAR